MIECYIAVNVGASSKKKMYSARGVEIGRTKQAAMEMRRSLAETPKLKKKSIQHKLSRLIRVKCNTFMLTKRPEKLPIIPM